MNYSVLLRKKLFKLIDNMERDKSSFVVNPKRDFVRKRKLTFKDTMKLILSFGKENTYWEMMSYFRYKPDMASTSAFCQQRQKIKPEAFEKLFYDFNNSLNNLKKHKGYRLLACDGSDIPVTLKEYDDAYLPHCGASPDCEPHMHLNALYDICNHIYVDAVIEPSRKHNEKSAFIQMLYQSYTKDKTLYIMDRGYECYNIMAHITSLSQYFLIRIKDNHTGGFALSFPHPNTEEYDVFHDKILTQKFEKKYKNNPKCICLHHKSELDYFTQDHEAIRVPFRILRIKITDDTYECIATNLPQEQFGINEIKELYHMRWGIETSFRELKYMVGLLYFHSTKKELILQEIYASLITYNFCNMIANQIRITTEHRRLKYQLNYSHSIKICCMYLKDNTLFSDIEKLIKAELLPVRPDRSYPRDKKNKCRKSFLYRV